MFEVGDKVKVVGYNHGLFDPHQVDLYSIGSIVACHEHLCLVEFINLGLGAFPTTSAKIQPVCLQLVEKSKDLKTFHKELIISKQKNGDFLFQDLDGFNLCLVDNFKEAIEFLEENLDV